MIPVPRNSASERSKKEITPFEYPQVKNIKSQYKSFHTNSNLPEATSPFLLQTSRLQNKKNQNIEGHSFLYSAKTRPPLSNICSSLNRKIQANKELRDELTLLAGHNLKKHVQRTPKISQIIHSFQ